MSEIRRPFDMVLPESLWGLIHLLENEGHRAYVVGGAVRDSIMGLDPKDHDVATDATPDQVLGILGRVRAWRTNEVGRSFGVVRARHYAEDGTPLSDEYEVATFRKDVGVGRRPDAVVFTSVEEDVKRRDFTMNALFYDARAREVVDLVGGLRDIESGVVRTVGRPEDRFVEDRLRIMRAVRFASRFGWSIDLETEAAIARDPRLTGVSPERIRDELVKAIDCAWCPPHLFDALERLGLWAHVLPGLKVSVGPDSLVSTRGFDTNDPCIALALLLDAEDVRSLGKRLYALRYTREEVTRITSLLSFRDLDAPRAFTLRGSMEHVGLSLDQLSEYMVQRGMPDRNTFSAFARYLDTPPVKGDDLMAQGYSGQALGVELRQREAILFEGLLEGRR